MSAKLISCRVVIDQLRPYLPADIATEVFEMSLHANPAKLQERLQRAVDESDGIFDPILLGYGVCSKAVIGLVARKSRLVVPRTDDCIELFLGSRKARLDQLAEEPGTYFLTRGYIGDGYSAFPDYERSVTKYGAERAERLLRAMLSHYTRLVYIRMPGDEDLEHDRGFCRDMAGRFGLRHIEMEGTADWIKRLVRAEWDEQFVVMEPGQPIERRHFMAF